MSLTERQHASAICRRIPYRSNHKLFNCLLWYCPRGTEWLTCDNQYCQQCSWTYKLLCCLTMTWIVFYHRAIEGINHVDALFNQKESVLYTVSLFKEKWEVSLYPAAFSSPCVPLQATFCWRFFNTFSLSMSNICLQSAGELDSKQIRISTDYVIYW